MDIIPSVCRIELFFVGEAVSSADPVDGAHFRLEKTALRVKRGQKYDVLLFDFEHLPWSDPAITSPHRGFQVVTLKLPRLYELI
jgi:hypothetical protein